jgi:hypothetical protein
MSKISTLSIIKQYLNLFKHYIKSIGGDTSYAGEYAHLQKVMNQLNIKEGFVVDIAASDGVDRSSTLGFFKDNRWTGLAVEMDPFKFSKLSFLYANFPNAKLARSRITPANVASILQGFEVPFDFTLLNLDIDSYDLFVIDEMLKSGFNPKCISMEINEKIPPHIFFTVNYDDAHYWQGDHFFGCSLTAASEVVKSHGYILESLQYNNAIFIRSDIASNLFDDLSAESAYALGYRDKPDRKKLFPYNSDVDCLLDKSREDAIVFLNDFFKKYNGKYTLR